MTHGTPHESNHETTYETTHEGIQEIRENVRRVARQGIDPESIRRRPIQASTRDKGERESERPEPAARRASGRPARPIRLSALDASFVYGEDQRIPLHVGALAVLDAAPLRNEEGVTDLARIRRTLAERLHLLPIFRKKLLEVPFDQARPVWVDDPDFRIENHVQLCALPQPGDRAALLELMGRIQQIPLDRNKPLWEIHFVEGLAGGDSIAMMYKVHHSMVDGTSSVEIATLLYDPTPNGREVEPETWEPEALPNRAELVIGALTEGVLDGIASIRGIAQGIAHPGEPVRHARNFARALDTMRNDIPRLPFNSKVSSRRAFATCDIPMERVLALKNAYGVSVNDLVLGAVSGALRRYCGDQGIDANEVHHIRAVVPVDNRVAGDKSAGCKVSSMFVDLPVGEPDARRRLVQIHQLSKRLKSMEVADGVNMWARITSALPTPLLRAASWVQFRGLLSRANLMVSNVRGPAFPLYHLGAELKELYPYFGVQDEVGLNIVLVSYNGTLMIGLAGDPEQLPQLSDIAEGLTKAFDELTATTRAENENENGPAPS